MPTVPIKSPKDKKKKKTKHNRANCKLKVKMGSHENRVDNNTQVQELTTYVRELRSYIEVLVNKNKELENKIESYENGKKLNDQVTMDLEQEEQSLLEEKDEYPTITIQRKKRKKNSEPNPQPKSVKDSPPTSLISTEESKKTTADAVVASEVGEKPKINNKKKEKVPPIVAYNINTKSTINKLNEAIGKNSFTIKKINKNVTHIITADISSFLKAMETVKAEDKQYYTYTPKEMKHETILLKGVDGSFDEGDITAAFEDLQVSQHILKISKYHTRKSLKDNRDLNIWLIQLKPNSDVSVLTNIKFILHQSVSFERLVRSETIQCKNCQRYGHAASNCNMQYRCVKCIEQHGPGQCPKTDRTTEPYCINCNKTGHPANYRQCPKYQELQARKEQVRKQQEEQQLEKRQMYNNYYTPHRSYSKTVQPRISNNSQIQSKSIKSGASTWDQTCNSMFGLDFTDTLREFYNFTPSFNAIQDPIQKKITLFEFFAKITQNG